MKYELNVVMYTQICDCRCPFTIIAHAKRDVLNISTNQDPEGFLLLSPVLARWDWYTRSWVWVHSQLKTVIKVGVWLGLDLVLVVLGLGLG